MAWTVIGAMLLAGAAPAAGRPEVISYETGGCLGACPVYTVTVSSDGNGLWEGRYHTAITGKRRFRITPAQWAAFRRRLEPLRPAGDVRYDGLPLCKSTATDQSSAQVRWSGAFRPASLYVYYGCDMEAKATLIRTIASAPDALPLAGFIGRR